MQLYINSNNERNIFVLIKIIGVTESLLKKAITIDEAEQIIFSPYYSEILKEQEISNEIIELIECGFEFEDVESLLPDSLDIEIQNIRDKALKILTLMKKPEVIERWLIEK